MCKESRYLLAFGVFFMIVFLGLLSLVLSHSIHLFDTTLDSSKLADFGSYIGGSIGTLVAVFAVFAAGFAFYAQYEANRQVQEQFEKQESRDHKINFETKFFELIKIHRENVSEQVYTKFEINEMGTAVGRKVFRLMHRELEECIKEVFRYRKIYTQDFIIPKYRLNLENVKIQNNLDINIEDLALIDIAYKIFFFGLGKESEDYLLNSFRGKYNYLFFKRLMKFLQLKPKMENIEEFKLWNKIYKLKPSEIKNIIDEVYRNRAKVDFKYDYEGSNLVYNYKKNKYYGGQQHRLGHYFRHLFQTYKYLFLEENITDEDKYFYGKTLRGQISTYEQSIFFVNSLSSLGQKWELIPEIDYKIKKEMKLISEYNIIKNVPGDKFLDIVYIDYYPKVDFEFIRVR